MNFLIKSVKRLLIAGVALLFYSHAYGETLDRVVAKVNGDIIVLSAVQEKAGYISQQLKAGQGKLPDNMSEEQLLEKVLNDMVDEKLQLQEARKIMLSVDEKKVEQAIDEIKSNNKINQEQLVIMLENEGKTLEGYKQQVRDQILVSQIIGYEMSRSPAISDKSVQKYYLKHQKEFLEAKKTFFRHILFIFEPGITDENKRVKIIKAKQVLRQIKAGRDFEDLAKKYSEDVSSSSGGEIGYVAKGNLVAEFEEAAFKLKEGEVSDLVETRYGLHIIKNDHIVPGRVKPMDEVKEQIRERLMRETRKAHYENWMASLKKSAFVETYLFDSPKSLQNKEKPPRLARPSIKEKKNSKRLGRRSLKEKGDRSVREPENSDPFFEEWEEADLRKNAKGASAPSEFISIEQELNHFKYLLDKKEISESEYQERKQKLLDQL
jgi:peptidyl-prolyl cis-trans isomerase SurA